MKHVHKYKKFQTTHGKDFWRCMLPNCVHVLYDKMLLYGRMCICWYCGEPFTIVDPSQTKPVCSECKENRKERREKLKRIS